MKLSDILIKPHITEKALSNAKNLVYTFEVAQSANKNQIKEVVEKLFNVKVGSVTTTIKKNITKRVGKKRQFKTLPDIKIAYIKITSGTIDVFPKT